MTTTDQAPTRVTITRSDGTAEVDGYPVRDYLAVTPIPDSELWGVTHISTGLSVRIPSTLNMLHGYGYRCRSTAETFARELAGMGDWSTRSAAQTTLVHSATTIRDLQDRLYDDDLTAWCDAPTPEWPETDDDVTADRMARVLALDTNRLHNGIKSKEFFALKKGDSGYDDALRAYTASLTLFSKSWGELFLLRAIIEHAPDKADQIAADLWHQLEFGDCMGEFLWDWLVEYRINPNAGTADGEVSS